VAHLLLLGRADHEWGVLLFALQDFLLELLEGGLIVFKRLVHLGARACGAQLTCLPSVVRVLTVVGSGETDLGSSLELGDISGVWMRMDGRVRGLSQQSKSRKEVSGRSRFQRKRESLKKPEDSEM
jgi:hypothetical protein